MPASIAVARRIKGRVVVFKLLVSDDQPAAACHRRAVAGDSGRENAIENIDSPFDRVQNHPGRADAH